MRAAINIRGSACRVQQKAIMIRFEAKQDQSKVLVCVSVIRGIRCIVSEVVDQLLIEM